MEPISVPERNHGIPVDVTDHRAVLAARLRNGRRAIGLTQQDVADALEMPRTAVSDLEAGKRKLYGLELRRIARLYRRPVGWFLGDEDPSTSLDEATQILEGLSQTDRQAVLEFARFLAHQPVKSS